jgi:hypothetical protein
MFKGSVVAINCDEGVFGWATELSRPRKNVTVEILINGVVMGTAKTSGKIFEPIDNRLAGEKFPFKFAWTELVTGESGSAESVGNQTVNVSVRVQNTEFFLDGAMELKVEGELKQALFPLANKSEQQGSVAKVRPKVIAFYLPQYHPIPENNKWWGEGFTEWTNVSQGRPVFQGHHQPHVPGALGFYDLRLPQARAAQAALAKKHGVYGFCYYYYWFSGRKILEGPLRDVLASGKPDLPFCICWANETWSRRWDGSESEVLLKQEHTPETDIDFIHDVIPILKDPRYIRVGSAPLLLVYRISLFPSSTDTALTWRKICAENGIPEVHLCAVESFQISDPAIYGFDSSVEFPPHNNPTSGINSEIPDLDPEFKGGIFDYAELVARDLFTSAPPYTRFKGLMLGWDNSARRKLNANIFVNSSPETYEVWLNGAITHTRKHLPSDRQIIFVNAWNEWAEGTHLEPDLKFGTKYLEATERAVNGASPWQVFSRMSAAKFDPELQGLVLERAQSEILIRDRTIEYLKGIVQERGSLLTTGRFRAEIPSIIGASQSYTSNGYGNLDQVRSEQFTKLTKVALNEITFLSGWFVNPLFSPAETQIFWLVLTNIGSKTAYFATLLKRTRRDDVAAIYDEVAKDRATWSGFHCYLDFSQVIPGEYEVGAFSAFQGVVGYTRLNATLFVE